MVDSLGLEYPVLYDTDHSVTQAFGLFNLLGDGVSAPATFVFAADGTLVAYRIGQSAADRPPVGEVIEVIVDSR